MPPHRVGCGVSYCDPSREHRMLVTFPTDASYFGFLIPIFLMREATVVGFMPSSSAAPFEP